MNIKTSTVAQIVLFAVAILYSLYMAAHLPDVVPTHWGINGKPDAYGSKWINLLIMPGVLLVLAGLTYVLPIISPQKFRMQPFEETYGVVFFFVSLMMLAIHVVIVQASVNAGFDMNRVLMAVIFGFFAVIGNMMGRVKRNFFMGIRTPWTIADERVWHSTHRFAARLWLVGGAAGAIAALAGAPIWFSVALLMGISFLPVFKSYVDYTRLPHDTSSTE
jgi:uncharacterized membrane protein